MNDELDLTDPDSERLPLVEGGQGRSARAVETAACVFLWCMLLGLFIACVAHIWGRVEPSLRPDAPPKAQAVEVRQ